MKSSSDRHAKSRRAILDALAEIVGESGVVDFSIQQVADRAGVTHRTVYNHFPTRQELNDAFAEYVEELAVESGVVVSETLDVERLLEVTRQAMPVFAAMGKHLRAYVRLMIASGAPARVATRRTDALRRQLTKKWKLSRREATGVAAALRMFVSSTGWHLLTEHYGLTTEGVAEVTEWAVRVLLEAVERGDLPKGRK